MRKIYLVLAASLLIFASCDDDDTSTETESGIKEEFVANYVAIVRASYADALSEATEMQTAINTFVASPTEANFTAAKQAWLDAREPYGQTEVYRFYDGPIDGDDGEPEGYLNAWPLDEALIDYVASGTGGEDASVSQNIVSNTTDFPTINEEALRNATGANDNESNVALGYHAIEFLLWGQDTDAPSLKTSGQREYTDYVVESNESAERRGQYLTAVTEILISDLQSVVDQWENANAYRDEFLALDVDVAINNILTGAAKLSKGELAGERMAVAVENQDQEDEHSCFSDNTHKDIFLNAQGINNIINGTYTKVDGSTVSGISLLDVVSESDEELAQELSSLAAEVMTKVTVISDEGYFDNQIMGETIDNTTNPVMSAVSSLRDQGEKIAEVVAEITGATIDPNV